MPNPSVALALSLLVQLNVTAPGPATTPIQSVRAFADAYTQRSLEKLAGLLAGDFHFTTSDARMAALIHEVSRERELQVASNIFNGHIQDGKVVMPAADSVLFTVDGFTENADPEHPDSTGHYRVVAVTRFATIIKVPDRKDFMSVPALHVFHVVRGDAAVLASGQAADSTRWYIRRWLEDVSGLATALGQVEGDCAQADSAVAAKALATLPFGIHPLGNPACPALDIACDLPAAGPARIEVFDVMGRRLQQKDFDVAAPGTMKLQAGAGVHLAPGAYWVRLTQASRHSTRMVVVAR